MGTEPLLPPNRDSEEVETVQPGSTDNLRILYEVTYHEISRLRDYEWRITYYFILLSLAAVGFVLSDATRSFVTDGIRIALIAVVIGGQILGVYHLWKTHTWLTQQRNIRRGIEDVLGFYDGGVYRQEPILPWKGKSVSNSFQAFDLILPMLSGMIAVSVFVIYLLWEVEVG